MGKVCHVIYSHVERPITKEHVIQGLSLKPFPYVIEVIRGILSDYNFPVNEISKLKSSIQKIGRNRTDALVAAQEEGDYEINLLKSKYISISV